MTSIPDRETLKTQIEDPDGRKKAQSLLVAHAVDFIAAVDDTSLVALLVENAATAQKILDGIEKYLPNNEPTVPIMKVASHLILKFHLSPDLPRYLRCLDSEQEDIHGLLMLVIVWQCKENSQESESKSLEFFNSFLQQEPAAVGKSEYLLSLRALAALFPIFPESMSSIYISDKMKNALMYRILLISPSDFKEDVPIAEDLLKLVSVTCLHEKARSFNTEYFLPFLAAGSKQTALISVRALSLLCLVKLWSMTKVETHISQDEILTRILDSLEAENSEGTEYLLEALSYLTLGSAARQSLRQNPTFLQFLTQILETEQENTSVVYATLVILSSLTRVKESATLSDRKTVEYLKSVANTAHSEPDNKDEVFLFNADLLAQEHIISTLNAMKVTSTRISHAKIKILHHIALNPEREIQREIVAQGGTTIILDYLTLQSKIEHKRVVPIDDSELSLEIRLYALRTLASICRSVNPALLFRLHEPRTAVNFLIELLGDQSETLHPLDAQLDNLDRLIALLALTDICSLPDKTLHSLVTQRTFEQYLQDILIDTAIPETQRAAWELVNNLSGDPHMLAKFFNPADEKSMRNLEILTKMLNSRDEKLQVVIAGMIANATLEYPLVSKVMCEKKDILNRLMGIVCAIYTEQTNRDLHLRTTSFLMDILELASQDPEALAVVKSQNLTQGLRKIQSSDPELGSMAAQIVDFLQ